MKSKNLLSLIVILYIIILVIGLLILTNCSHKAKKEVDTRSTNDTRGTCVRVGPKGTEIIEPCWK